MAYTSSTETVNGRTLVIFGDEARATAIGFDFTPDAEDAPVALTASVRGHQRRLYKGDPGFSVAGHTRSELFSKDKAGTAALPGKPFFIEVTTGTPPNTVTKVTRFSYQGRWSDLKSKMLLDLAPAPNTVLRNASGSSKVMVAAT
jgi:hypothetical protein